MRRHGDQKGPGRLLFVDGFGQLKAIHAAHLNITHHCQVSACQYLAQRFFAGRRIVGVVTRTPQDFDHRDTDQFIVIDHQNGCSARHAICRLANGQRRRCQVGHGGYGRAALHQLNRQRDGELAAALMH